MKIDLSIYISLKGKQDLSDERIAHYTSSSSAGTCGMIRKGAG